MKHNILRHSRLMRDLDFDELSELTGLHKYTLQAIESGRKPCRELCARRLGEYFGLDWKMFISKAVSES